MFTAVGSFSSLWIITLLLASSQFVWNFIFFLKNYLLVQLVSFLSSSKTCISGYLLVWSFENREFYIATYFGLDLLIWDSRKLLIWSKINIIKRQREDNFSSSRNLELTHMYSGILYNLENFELSLEKNKNRQTEPKLIGLIG